MNQTATIVRRGREYLIAVSDGFTFTTRMIGDARASAAKCASRIEETWVSGSVWRRGPRGGLRRLWRVAEDQHQAIRAALAVERLAQLRPDLPRSVSSVDTQIRIWRKGCRCEKVALLTELRRALTGDPFVSVELVVQAFARREAELRAAQEAERERTDAMRFADAKGWANPDGEARLRAWAQAKGWAA